MRRIFRMSALVLHCRCMECLLIVAAEVRFRQAVTVQGLLERLLQGWLLSQVTTHPVVLGCVAVTAEWKHRGTHLGSHLGNHLGSHLHVHIRWYMRHAVHLNHLDPVILCNVRRVDYVMRRRRLKNVAGGPWLYIVELAMGKVL